MNKNIGTYAKEELLSLEVENTDKIPLLDCVYIVPTKKKHNSGFRKMIAVGISKKENYAKIIDTFSDVISFEKSEKSIRMDIEPKNDCLHIWPSGKGLKICVKWAVSDFSFSVVEDEVKI